MLFSITEFGSGDLEQAIRGADTAAAWWRQQTSAHGLGAVLERSFQGWARDTTTRWGASDIANDQLLAASLNANLAGDRGEWRYLSSLLGRDALLRLNRESEPAAVSSGLTALRLAGAEEALKLATMRVVRDGPALGTRSAAADIRLSSSTRTTAPTNLGLLRYAGPVLDEETASVTIQWITDTLANPIAFNARAAPAFEVTSRLLDTLAAVVLIAPVSSHLHVIDYLLAQPPITNQPWAISWAEVVRQLDPAAWTAEKAMRASELSDRDYDGLRYSLLGVAAS